MGFKMLNLLIDNAAYPSAEKSAGTFVGLTSFEPTILYNFTQQEWD
jgi:hypothetical protein